MAKREFKIIVPDDFHHHLRDGDYLSQTTSMACKSFKRVIVMPNLDPSITTLIQAVNYGQRIKERMGIFLVHFFNEKHLSLAL